MGLNFYKSCCKIVYNYLNLFSMSKLAPYIEPTKDRKNVERFCYDGNL